ncbi:transcriptional regulator, TetR family [Jatrophihabitans endophyticus]|uniref:Transcriptional regulator, TetR family n=1 Tax=Jatrophihabitans endophyticus TaxID=1206085 RepID=A0A1M5EN82_9ACTN|nr:TetR/AcrR family transcriptional regulator C-terminal domain-containing protein [Jatrophihabitans endophyticus]SHF80689.1 transcriptional regulator, TetR family [Jatrophihabitans endophyticus]
MSTHPFPEPTPPGSLWDRQPPRSRDRSSVLTREEIAAAAFAVAEVESLPAVSVKRVAGRLGIPGVRLQHYLTDRAELLDLMVDVALGEVERWNENADWPVQLWQLAHAVRETVRRRPWLSGLLGLRAPSGPNGLRFSERTIAAMNSAGVDVHTAARCLETVLVYVCGSVRPEAVSATARGGAGAADVASYLAAQLTEDSFPLLTRLVANPSALTPDEVFDTGLGYLLGGMAAGLAADVGDLDAAAGAGVAATRTRGNRSLSDNDGEQRV